MELAFSSVVHVTVALVCPGVPEEMEERTGGLLRTVIGSVVEALTPALLVTMAFRVCEPSETPVEFHVVVYGEEVRAEPMLLPSTWNCTLATPTSSEAVAVKVTADPPTVAPLVGALKETVGGPLSTVIDSEEVA